MGAIESARRDECAAEGRLEPGRQRFEQHFLACSAGAEPCARDASPGCLIVSEAASPQSGYLAAVRDAVALAMAVAMRNCGPVCCGRSVMVSYTSPPTWMR